MKPIPHEIIYPVIVGLILILAAAFWNAIIAFLKWLLIPFYRSFHNTTKLPTETLRLVPLSNGAVWRMASKGDNPAMQVTFRYSVTNITNLNIKIANCIVKTKNIDHMIFCIVQDHRVISKSILPPQSMLELNIDFFVLPPTVKVGELFKTDVVVIDQFGNEHKIKKVKFKYQ